MDNYEKANQIIKDKKHLAELEEIRKNKAINEETNAKETMIESGYVSQGSAKLAAEQENREKQNRIQENERELSNLQQSMNSATFRKLKEMYKQDSLFSRLSRKVKGEAPNWNKIANYNPEVLDYLEAVREGNTYSQKKEYNRHKKAFKDINKGMEGRKVSGISDEGFQAKYFNQFLRKLAMSEPALLREIEAEKKRKEADIALYGRNIAR